MTRPNEGVDFENLACCAQCKAVFLMGGSQCLALTNSWETIIITTFLSVYPCLWFDSNSFACSGMSVLLLHVRREREWVWGHLASKVER